MTSLIKRSLLGITFIMLTVALASCNFIRRETQFGDTATFAVDQTVYLACSASCRDQQQCGDLVQDGNPAVFLSRNGASTRSHDLIQPQNLPVTVLEIADLPMVGLADNNQLSQLNFYRVSVQQDGGFIDGWVAGWCLGDGSMQ